MILATTADRPAIEAFLYRHFATSMYPLSYLAQHGMEGGHQRAMAFWVHWVDGQITDVLSVTDAGMVFPQCPTGPWAAIAKVMADASVLGVMGEVAQVTACLAALGLPDGDLHERTEPQFSLPLDALVIPDRSGFTLCRFQEVDLNVVIAWRIAFAREIFGCSEERAIQYAAIAIRQQLDEDSHRVLLKDGEPVSVTGFTGMLPEAVQVGGVFTPLEKRSRGYARMAVALHLEQVRDAGATDAVLAVANAPAGRAYQAIGFRDCGQFRSTTYKKGQEADG